MIYYVDVLSGTYTDHILNMQKSISCSRLKNNSARIYGYQLFKTSSASFMQHVLKTPVI